MPLRYLNSYFVSSTDQVATNETTFQDDTPAVLTLTPSEDCIALIIFTARKNKDVVIGLGENDQGKKIGLSINGETVAAAGYQGIPSGLPLPYDSHDTVVHVATLSGGVETTIQGLFLATAGWVEINERQLLVITFTGSSDDYYFTQNTTSVSTSLTDLQTDVSNSFVVKERSLVLVIYSAGDASASDGDYKKLSITIDGVVKASTWTTNNSKKDVGTVIWIGWLDAGTYTIAGKYAAQTGELPVSISERQFAILCLAAMEFDFERSETAVTTTSITFVDDTEATVTRSPSDTAKMTILYSTGWRGPQAASVQYGTRSAITVNDSVVARSGQDSQAAAGGNAFCTWNVSVTVGASTTVDGQFCAFDGNGTVIHERQMVVLWFSAPTTQTQQTRNMLMQGL